MATEKDVQAKRDSVNALREQIAEAKQTQLSTDAQASAQYRLDRLGAEEQSLKAELAALKGSAPAPAAPPAPNKAAVAAENKE